MSSAHRTRIRAAERRPPLSVSVVLPLLNKAAELETQLDALAAQAFEQPWELVIVDNGSTDGSVEIACNAIARFGSAQLIEAPDAANASVVRNIGAAAASGELLLFTDADDLAQPGWIAGMAEAAARGDLIAGGVSTHLLNDESIRAWHVLLPRERALSQYPFLSYASGTNTGVWADAFRELGGFDEHTPVGEDIELSWRAQVAGYRLVHAPAAVVEYRLRSDIGSLVRQHYSYGQAGPHLYRRYRDHGMRRVGAGLTARGWARVGLGWPGALASRRLRGRWALEAGYRAGQLRSCARERVVFL
jgi:glycosyltransferase involved in cell wall biosynthesis